MRWTYILVLLTALLTTGQAAAQAIGAPPSSLPVAPVAFAPAAAPPDTGSPDQPPPVPPAPSPADAALPRVEAAIENAMTLLRPGQIGLATIWDGNKFVQCRQKSDAWVTCEAAGTAMQPSLAHVITVDRAMRLFALGWLVDPHFGNYLRAFPAGTSARSMARQVVRTLDEGYGADLANLEVRTTWVRDTKCPSRNGPRQNLAGSINDTPLLASTAIHTCTYRPAMLASVDLASVAAFLGLYGQQVRAEIQRLIVNSGTEGIHVVLSSTDKNGYVQCAPDNAPPSLYCEAASADSVPALSKVLTPDRIAELHALGFGDPGRAPNYSRITPLKDADAHLLTRDLLTILFDVYGYRGDPILRIATEKGK